MAEINIKGIDDKEFQAFLKKLDGRPVSFAIRKFIKEYSE